MRRGESGIGVSNAGSTVARIAPAMLSPDASWHSQARKIATPVRVRLIQLYAKTPAAHACSVTLALHGAAIAHNLECVLTTLDPEGPHQLRIALRRTRVALKVFEPVMRTKVNTRLVETARALGTIAGELRDADVLIDEIIAPAARDETGLMVALTAWRQEVRGRVRARLLAGDAPAMAANFAHAAGAPGWLKSNATRADMTFADLIATAEQTFWDRASPLAARMADLSHLELHQLRKAVKAMRYGAELAASAGLGGNVVPRLKRIQDALGYANDTAALEQFNPPVFGEASAFQRVRARLIAERQAGVADAISAAMREWRVLTPPAAAV
jgi:triphosphatase